MLHLICATKSPMALGKILARVGGHSQEDWGEDGESSEAMAAVKGRTAVGKVCFRCNSISQNHIL